MCDRVRIHISCGTASCRDDLQKFIRAQFVGKLVWEYIETVMCCKLDYIDDGALFAFSEGAGDLFEGRVFSTEREFHYLRETAESFKYWIIEDAAGGSDNSPEYTKSTCRQYLIGEWKAPEKKYGFFEGRYGKEFLYPTGSFPAHTPEEGDRAWLEVTKYRQCPPRNWSSDSSEINRTLNQPIEYAYRFSGFGVGRT